MAQTYQYQLLPDLGQTEYLVLKADIGEHGILVPVEVDEHGTLLDGHHRVRAWTELTAEGVEVADYPRMIRAGLTEHQKRAHVRLINLVRRHLTQEQRRALIADQLKDTPEQSNNRIASALGVSQNTVDAVRDELETTFQIEKLDRAIGRDGKSRPVRYSTTMARDKKEEKQALKNLGLLDAGAQKEKFVCEQCGELFAVDVWHCGNCDHHWSMADEQCRNCYQDRRAEYAPQRNVAGDRMMTATDVQRLAKEQEREAKREGNRSLVAGTAQPDATTRYATLVLDPPWDWGDEGDQDQLGRSRPTYGTMTIDQVADIAVPDLAAQDAHIYLWITNRSLPKGFDLLEGWGFRYVTMLTWVKPSIGMGNYFRGSTEQVLFGVRGSLGLLRRDVGTWFAAPRPDRHSAKPDAFYGLVETCSPGPWLELFARRERPGWAHWGAEV